MLMRLTVKRGDTFSTPFESGCIALSDPDEYGNFDGLDSDRVVCGFSLAMLTEVIPCRDDSRTSEGGGDEAKRMS